MYTVNVLDGFTPVELGSGGKRNMPTSCKSRALLEAFLASGEECISKPMTPSELNRTARNLRHYRQNHAEEFSGVGIAARNGSLLLYRANRPTA